MRRTLVILLMLSIGLNVGLLVRTLRAPGPRPSLDQVLERHLQRMTDGLELDGQQQAALREVHETMLPSVQEARASMDRFREAAGNSFPRVVEAPDVFRERIHELQQARAQLDSLLTDLMLAEMFVLNPDQREKYIEVSPWGRRLAGAPRPKGSRRR